MSRWTSILKVGGGKPPLETVVEWVSGPDNLSLSVDGLRVTATEIVDGQGGSGTLRATVTDDEGNTVARDFAVTVPAAPPPPGPDIEITLLNVAAEGNTDQILLYTNGGTNDVVEDNQSAPPFALVPPTFADLFPAWNFSDPLIPEDTNYQNLYLVEGLNGITTREITVGLRGLVGGEAIDWQVTDGGNVVINTFDSVAAENQPSMSFTVTLDPGVVFNDPRSGSAEITATVDGVPYIATVYFYFALLGT